MKLYRRAFLVLVASIPLAGFASPGDAFDKQVADYVKLHRRLAKTLPRLKTTGTSATIENHQQVLARKIQSARASAHQGAIFTPDATREFQRLVRVTLAAADAGRVRGSLQNAEPVHAGLQVNASYPSGAPLQSPPPTLLAAFPRLPAELDYRVVGSSLVLRDTIANVIVDFIPDLLPGPK